MYLNAHRTCGALEKLRAELVADGTEIWNVHSACLAEALTTPRRG